MPVSESDWQVSRQLVSHDTRTRTHTRRFKLTLWLLKMSIVTKVSLMSRLKIEIFCQFKVLVLSFSPSFFCWPKKWLDSDSAFLCRLGHGLELIYVFGNRDQNDSLQGVILCVLKILTFVLSSSHSHQFTLQNFHHVFLGQWGNERWIKNIDSLASHTLTNSTNSALEAN